MKRWILVLFEANRYPRVCIRELPHPGTTTQTELPNQRAPKALGEVGIVSCFEESCHLTSVSVCWSYCNKALQTKWLINNQKVFLTILKARSPRSVYPHGQVLVRAPFQMAIFSLQPHMAEKGQESSLGFFLQTYESPKAHLIPLHWGVGFQYQNLQGDTNIQSIAPSVPYKYCCYSHVPRHKMSLEDTCQSSHVFPISLYFPLLSFISPSFQQTDLFTVPQILSGQEKFLMIPLTLNPRPPSIYWILFKFHPK